MDNKGEDKRKLNRDDSFSLKISLSKGKNLSSILKTTKEQIKNLSEPFFIKHDHVPLNKNDETKILEIIVKESIKDSTNEDKQVKFFTKNGKETYQTGTDLYVKIYDTELNFSNLIKNVNFTHLSFKDEEIQKYSEAEFHKKNFSEFTTLKEELMKNLEDLSESYKQNILVEEKLDEKFETIEGNQVTVDELIKPLVDLNFGEKLAIHYYTKDPTVDIANILSGYKQGELKTMDQIKESVMSTAITSHGLNKLPTINSSPKYVIRGAEEKLLKYKAINHAIKELPKLTSASIDSQVASGFASSKEKNVTIYDGIPGKFVAPISQWKHELEFLVPPSTQVQYTGYREIPYRLNLDEYTEIASAKAVNVLLPDMQSFNEIENEARTLYENSGDAISKDELKKLLQDTIGIYKKYNLVDSNESDFYIESKIDSDIERLHNRSENKHKLISDALDNLEESLGLKDRYRYIDEHTSNKKLSIDDQLAIQKILVHYDQKNKNNLHKKNKLGEPDNIKSNRKNYRSNSSLY